MRAWIVAVSLYASLGCRTTATETVSSVPTPSVRIGTHARTWEVHCEGELLGLVVLFQERGLARDSVYVVRNPWNQDLGLIDGLGRAFRYLPHHAEPAWVGSGTIAVGAQRILGAQATCELVERAESVPLAPQGPASAAARRMVTSPSDAPPSDGGLPQSR
jgi:hypothetical protein